MENTNDRKRFLPIRIVQQLKEYSVQFEQIDEDVKNIYKELNASVDTLRKNHGKEDPEFLMEMVNHLPLCETRINIESRLEILFIGRFCWF